MPKQPPTPATFSDLYEAMQREKEATQQQTENDRTTERPAGAPVKQSTARSEHGPTEPPMAQSKPRPVDTSTLPRIDRPKERHSFDVYSDQVRALARMQLEIYDRAGRKPKIGELVQEALDEYIERYRRRMEETGQR